MTAATKPVTACVLIIGNEVLSGRTDDENLNWLAGRLTGLGIRLVEARVIPDEEDVIADVLNETRVAHDYVFTTGGIGPTHDDITAASVARAFGVEVERNAEAETLLRKHIPAERLNAARLKMADVPVGATLIDNPVSRAPGFKMGNVFVLAGVPSIMRAMFESVRHDLVGGDPILSRSVAAFKAEGDLADGLGRIQDAHPNVDVGSYPFFRMRKYGVSMVSRSTDADELEAVVDEIRDLIRALGAEPIEEPED